MKSRRVTKTRLLATGASLLAILTGVASAPSPAEAAGGPHHWMYTDEQNPLGRGGRVDFWPQGDVVQVCDQLPDGAHVVLEVGDNTGGHFVYDLEASGGGVCKTARASDNPAFNLAEGHCFQFSLHLSDNGHDVPGSFDYAWWRNYNDAKANCDP